jgi:DNA-binding LytR/AlgR family response regulator
MKITIREDERLDEVEVIIHCGKIDEQVSNMVSALSNLDKKLTGTKNGRTFVLDPASILYFESVDKKTFAYAESEVYEIPLWLYELEGRLPRDFFRASKSAIINISKIKSIMPDFGGRIEATLVNGERLIVSRQYAHDLKNKLEL